MSVCFAVFYQKYHSCCFVPHTPVSLSVCSPHTTTTINTYEPSGRTHFKHLLLQGDDRRRTHTASVQDPEVCIFEDLSFCCIKLCSQIMRRNKTFAWLIASHYFLNALLITALYELHGFTNGSRVRSLSSLIKKYKQLLNSFLPFFPSSSSLEEYCIKDLAFRQKS